MRFFDLFSGIGGFHRGMSLAGHDCVGACEIDEYARRIYARHFPETKIWTDITKINPAELPEFDCLCAGFPCQAFSVAGRRLGFEDTRGTLFFEIARIARQTRPRILFLENVKGLLFHDEGRTFATILKTLDDLGYDAQWQCIDSKYFVPQHRERVFIIGHLRETPRPKVFPVRRTDKKSDGQKPTETLVMLAHTKNKGKRIQERDSTWTLSTNDADFGLIRLNKPKHQSQTVYDSKGLARTLTSCAGGRFSQTGAYVDHQSDRVYDAAGHGKTLDTNGSGWYKTDSRIRKLTPVECERLQGFPDGWTEGISDTQRYRCCGNAVTVDVIEWIGKRLE